MRGSAAGRLLEKLHQRRAIERFNLCLGAGVGIGVGIGVGVGISVRVCCGMGLILLHPLSQSRPCCSLRCFASLALPPTGLSTSLHLL